MVAALARGGRRVGRDRLVADRLAQLLGWVIVAVSLWGAIRVPWASPVAFRCQRTGQRAETDAAESTVDRSERGRRTEGMDLGQFATPMNQIGACRHGRPISGLSQRPPATPRGKPAVHLGMPVRI